MRRRHRGAGESFGDRGRIRQDVFHTVHRERGIAECGRIPREGDGLVHRPSGMHPAGDSDGSPSRLCEQEVRESTFRKIQRSAAGGAASLGPRGIAARRERIGRGRGTDIGRYRPRNGRERLGRRGAQGRLQGIRQDRAYAIHPADRRREGRHGSSQAEVRHRRDQRSGFRHRSREERRGLQEDDLQEHRDIRHGEVP